MSDDIEQHGEKRPIGAAEQASLERDRQQPRFIQPELDECMQRGRLVSMESSNQEYRFNSSGLLTMRVCYLTRRLLARWCITFLPWRPGCVQSDSVIGYRPARLRCQAACTSSRRPWPVKCMRGC